MSPSPSQSREPYGALATFLIMPLIAASVAFTAPPAGRHAEPPSSERQPVVRAAVAPASHPVARAASRADRAHQTPHR